MRLRASRPPAPPAAPMEPDASTAPAGPPETPPGDAPTQPSPAVSAAPGDPTVATPVAGGTPGTPLDLPPPTPARRRHRARWLVGALVAVVVAWLAAWGIDTALRGDASARNLQVAGVDVGGLAPAELEARITGIADGYQSTVVDATTPKGAETTDAATAGLALDVPATVQAVQQAPDATPAVLRPVAWLRSLVQPETVTPVMAVDESVLAASPLGALAAANSTPPIEPGLTADGAGVAPTPGVDGRVISLQDMATALVSGAEANPTGALRIELEPTLVPPTYTLADATALANEANRALRDPIDVRVGPVTFSLDGLTLAGWLATTPGPESLELTVDPVKATEGINALAGEVGTAEVPVRFVVNDGVVTTTPGTPAQRCCDPAAYQRLAAALFTPERVALLDLVEQPLERDQAWAESLRIVEPVGTFTTNFPAGQSRAENIIRIAEILQGTVIEPGATFSVNETTGPRGVEQGFVEGGVIVNGVVVNQVGGGISQFATTLFNAAFFAGLDIPDYMMHSLYISRYPYGREATLYYPSVDLKITNNTPVGILIWPTWTEDSITVTLYSSPWIIGEQTGQTTEPAGACTRVTTERTRTFLIDQTRKVDTFRALYQPEEGVRC